MIIVKSREEIELMRESALIVSKTLGMVASEIKEELETVIEVGELIHTVEYDYPTFHLSMDCFWCEIIKRNLVLKEAEDARWLTKDQLYDVKWLPTDITLIGIIEKCL